ASELDDDVASFQPGLLGGPAAAHPAQLDPLNLGSVVGNRAKVGAELLASAAAGVAVRDLQIIGPLRRSQEVGDELTGEAADAFHALVVDFVRRVGRAMVILVAPGEKVNHGHTFWIKRRY